MHNVLANLPIYIYFQPHLVKDSIQMKFKESGAIAFWEFSEGHVDTRNGHGAILGGKRWGAMVVLKSLESASTAIVAALKDSALYNSSEGNTMHIALLSAENESNMSGIRFAHVQY
jgi:acetyl-CoA carboxylase/biotin carboxylase 1